MSTQQTDAEARQGAEALAQRRAVLEARIRKSKGLNRCSAYNELGEFWFASNSGLALEYMQQSAQLLNEVKDKKTIASSRRYTELLSDNLNRQTQLLVRIGRFEDALESARRYLDIAKTKNDARQEITALLRVGKALYKLGNTNEAHALYEQAGELNDDDRALAAEIDIHRGEVLLVLGQTDRAERCLTDAMAILRDLPDANLEAFGTNLLGNARLYRNDYGAALAQYRKLEEFTTSNRDTYMQAHAHMNSGIVLQQLGDYGAALERYFQALKIYESQESKVNIAVAYRNIGSIYERLFRRDEALTNFHKALALADESGDLQEQAVILQNIANVHYSYNIKEHDRKALDYNQRALAIFRSVNNKRFIGLQLSYIGQIYYRLEKFRESRMYCRQALEIFQELDDNSFIYAMALAALADCELQLSNTKAVHELLNETGKIAESIQSNELLQRMHFQYYTAYDHWGNAEKALEHFVRYHEVKRLQFNEESDRRTRNLQVLHNVQQKEKEKEIYRLQNEKLAAEVEGQKKELTAQAMYLSQKNEVLKSVMQQLADLTKGTQSVPAHKIRNVERGLDSVLQDEQSWKAFEAQFQAVHPDFVKTITVTYPKLSPTEVKVCALIMLNLSTKESARILNISDRSVGEYRYRIRKKLGLTGDESLANFLARL